MSGVCIAITLHRSSSPPRTCWVVSSSSFQRDGSPDPVLQVFLEGKRGFGGWAVRLSDLVKILNTTIASLPEVFICIDG